MEFGKVMPIPKRYEEVSLCETKKKTWNSIIICLNESAGKIFRVGSQQRIHSACSRTDLIKNDDVERFRERVKLHFN